MHAMTDRAGSGFVPVPPEPWGRRLGRARADVAHLSLEEATLLVGHYMLTSDATISRLESLPEVPSGRRSGSRRQLAYLLCLAYRVDPADFGLSPDDLPPNLEVRPRGPQVGSSTKWYEPVLCAA